MINLKPVEDAIKAIAEPHRREIMRLVWKQELSAGEVASRFELTRPAVSIHLRILKDAGLISERRQGTRRLYRARPEGLDGLRAFLDEFWAGSLEELKVAAEAEERSPRQRGSISA
ncbi:MAG: ArsR/SmtB family transcription factor [Chloroflexota bacterium]